MKRNEEHEQLWSAYLDGELSASESARFDASLSQHDRERLAAEMQFESAMADVLGKTAGCPDEVWRRTIAKVEGTSQRRSYGRRKWIPAALGIAAALAVVVASVFAPHSKSLPEFVALNTELPESAIAGELPKAQAFLSARGVDIRLRPIEGDSLKDHEGTRILGYREARYGQEAVYELYYNCCGKPLKVALAKKGGAAAALLEKTLDGSNGIQSTRDVGEYRVALVGKHHAKELLDYFEPGNA